MKCTSTNIFQYGIILHVHVSDGIILHVRLTDVDHGFNIDIVYVSDGIILHVRLMDVDHGFIIDIVYVSDVRTSLVHCK